MDLPSLLARPGLDAGTRHLLLLQSSIWPADWPGFVAVLRSAMSRGVARPDVEEMLLQATLFFGFPRLVSAFEQLQAVWPVSPPPAGGGLPPAQQAAAGRELFAAIYGRNDAAVRTLLGSFHGEFRDFVLQAAYGRILTRKGLPERTRELLAVAALAVMAQVPQLVAHARGALHFGASRDELHEALITVLGSGRATDDLLRRV